MACCEGFGAVRYGGKVCVLPTPRDQARFEHSTSERFPQPMQTERLRYVRNRVSFLAISALKIAHWEGLGMVRYGEGMYMLPTQHNQARSRREVSNKNEIESSNTHRYRVNRVSFLRFRLRIRPVGKDSVWCGMVRRCVCF